MGSSDDVLAAATVGEISMIALLFTPLGRAGMIAAGVLVFVALFAMDQQNRGASKAVAKIEKATSHAVQKADRAGNSSISPSVRGVLDEHVRD